MAGLRQIVAWEWKIPPQLPGWTWPDFLAALNLLTVARFRRAREERRKDDAAFANLRKTLG